MPTAYVLINSEIGSEQEIISKLKKLPGVVEDSTVNGVYDIIVKVNSDTIYKLKENYNIPHKNNWYNQVNADNDSNGIGKSSESRYDDKLFHLMNKQLSFYKYTIFISALISNAE